MAITTTMVLPTNSNYPYDYTTWDTDNHNVAVFNSLGTATAVGGGTTTVTGTYTGPTDWYFTGVGCTCDSTATDSAYATLNVGDGTPVISSISNTEWPVGATTSNVVISGEYFGTKSDRQFLRLGSHLHPDDAAQRFTDHV